MCVYMEKFVLLYIFDSSHKHLYYILKDKPQITFLHEKLTGVGGRVEKFDTSIEAAMIREIKEELSIDLKKEKIPYTYRGDFIDRYGNEVYVFTSTFSFNLSQRYIEDEGWLVKKPLNYHKKHPEEFPLNNPEILDKVLQDTNKFSIDFRE